MVVNNSLKYLRKSAIYDSLECCSNDSQKINMLVDKVIELQNCLVDLQAAYYECLNKFNTLCAQIPS